MIYPVDSVIHFSNNVRLSNYELSRYLNAPEFHWSITDCEIRPKFRSHDCLDSIIPAPHPRKHNDMKRKTSMKDFLLLSKSLWAYIYFQRNKN